MSFSSRRRNYLLTPHRRDGLIEWMKSMLQHSFVLDALETTGAETFSHFEMLIEEHRQYTAKEKLGGGERHMSRLKLLVPTIGVFHTPLPLREAFELYNAKHRLTKRKHIQISFNEIRHILNLAQIMALRKEVGVSTDDATGAETAQSGTKVVSKLLLESSSNLQNSDFGSDDGAVATTTEGESREDNNVQLGSQPRPPSSLSQHHHRQFNGPRLISFDGDQTLYSDGENFERNPRLANYLYQLLRNGVVVAVVTAAGYEYRVEKYEYRLSGLLHYFKTRGLTEDECERFYLFGGECNYLLQLKSDYKLHAVKENGPGGWMTSTRYLAESPANWAEADVTKILDTAESQVAKTVQELNLRGRVIRKRRSVGLVPLDGHHLMSRESLDEAVLRAREDIEKLNLVIPFCAFNGGSDVWVDVGNKRVGVQVLQSYLGISDLETLHIGDQFLNTGNDYAARDVSPCIWIINPQETTYILKTILRLAGIVSEATADDAVSTKEGDGKTGDVAPSSPGGNTTSSVNFQEVERRSLAAKRMDVYTGEMK